VGNRKEEERSILLKNSYKGKQRGSRSNLLKSSQGGESIPLNTGLTKKGTIEACPANYQTITHSPILRGRAKMSTDNLNFGGGKKKGAISGGVGAAKLGSSVEEGIDSNCCKTWKNENSAPSRRECSSTES